MKLLITGGAGFIGSNFIHFVLETVPEVSIINLDKLTYAGNTENLKRWESDPRYRFVRGDIVDRPLLEELVPTVDAIVHFAAESHVDRSILDASDFVTTNVLGTFTLLDVAKKHLRRFHHISTDEIFGTLNPSDPPFTENTRYDPRSPYSASKAGADHLVRAYFHTYGLPVTISNTSNNYGPYHFPEKFIPLGITRLLEGKKVPVYGDGLQVRDWIHVEDHCRGIWKVLTEGKPGETYCFGGQNERTNVSVVRALLALLGLGEDRIEFVKDRPGHDRRYAIDASKARRELGWTPAIPFDEGLKQTVAWYEENRTWWERIKSGAYREYYREQYGA